MMYTQDHQTDWCFNRIKIVLYPETPASCIIQYVLIWRQNWFYLVSSKKKPRWKSFIIKLLRTASIDEYQSFVGYPQFLLINNAVYCTKACRQTRQNKNPIVQPCLYCRKRQHKNNVHQNIDKHEEPSTFSIPPRLGTNDPSQPGNCYTYTYRDQSLGSPGLITPRPLYLHIFHSLLSVL